jgi:hybrid cluster-associated redox disulfide protein
MDRYTKGFVVASLVYFFLAAVLGIWMGGTDAAVWVRFAHVHFNLLGFMAMMIYGVGYFILPRFNGRTLRWPSLVPIHFFFANIGLIGMVATAPERPSTGFVLFSALSVISAGMFAVNLGATMLMEPRKEEEEEEEPSFVEETEPATPASSASSSAPAGAAADKTAGSAPAAPPPAAPEIGPDMRVGEILTRWPQTVDVFVGNGFASLANPEHREQVKQIPITLRMACQRHNVDLDPMLAELNGTISPAFAAGAVSGATAVKTAGKPVAGKATGKLARGEAIGADHILGEILAVYPETEKVFRKYYGGGCFSCPGQATESVKQSAMMHNVNEKQLLAELNQSAGF